MGHAPEELGPYGYARPPITVHDWRDADGEVIRYGERWRDGHVPDDAYSATSNLERYEAVHTVAAALADWLEHTFEVTVERTEHAARTSTTAGFDLDRTLRITPTDSAATAISLGFTRLPGVVLSAGGAVTAAWPVCGCDACDEDVETVIGELESRVFSIVTGGVEEHLDRWSGTVEREWSLDGVLISRERMESTGRSGVQVQEGWAAWPLRRHGAAQLTC